MSLINRNQQPLMVETTLSPWKVQWANPAFRAGVFSCVLILAFFAFGLKYYFDFIEARTGKLLPDPVLDILPVRDISWTIFFFQYLTLLIGFTVNRNRPKLVLLAFQTYCLVTIFRVFTIYFIPLEPPIGYIPLQEPFVSLFTDHGRIISKDLFFSGHVSTLMSMMLTVHHRQFRTILTIFVIMVSFLLLVQHVHYTIDVIFSPFGTWLCYLFSKKYLQRKLK